MLECKHKQLNHAGQIAMCNLRKMFWILACRAAVWSVINNCVTCKRHKIKRLEAISGDLPNKRVREANIFETSEQNIDAASQIKEESDKKSTTTPVVTKEVRTRSGRRVKVSDKLGF